MRAREQQTENSYGSPDEDDWSSWILRIELISSWRMWPGSQEEEQKHRNPSLCFFSDLDNNDADIELFHAWDYEKYTIAEQFWEPPISNQGDYYVPSSNAPGILTIPRLETPTTYEFLTGIPILASATGRILFDNMISVWWMSLTGKEIWDLYRNFTLCMCFVFTEDPSRNADQAALV